MPRSRLLFLTLITMVAFAGNSLLCRVALQRTAIDATSFMTVRILSGAVALWLIVRLRGGTPGAGGSWVSALVMMAYAICFTLAYLSLPAATGALLLFGAVQVTMIGYGFSRGERLRGRQVGGLILAAGGLVWLLLPGLTAPSPIGSALMLAAGVAWGAYSLRGKGAGDPTSVTAGNFLRAAPLTLGVSVLMSAQAALDSTGLVYATCSGALTSGVGYAVWYTVMRGLTASSAAVVQLSVPVFAAIGGIMLLGEPVTARFVIASVAILGGIAAVILGGDARK